MTIYPENITASTPWHTLLRHAVTTAEQLASHFDIDAEKINQVIQRYPMRISPHYLSLIKAPGDPLWRQAVPHEAELADTQNPADPLAEEPQSPVPAIIHRYPGRVIFLVSGHCAMYCRHCMRKRKVGTPGHISHSHRARMEQGLDYIRRTPAVNEVILSGGDPLLLETEQLDPILWALKKCDHVTVIRIHTRTLCTLPQRITPDLVKMLRAYSPLYINTHFNHPDEITPASKAACDRLADAGIPLGCQSVLLKGVNDNARTMAALMNRLLEIRVKPYYLHHPDPVSGTAHFRPDIRVGLEIMKHLRGRLSGMAVPQYMIDLPGGHGKVPLLPGYVKASTPEILTVENYLGQRCDYPI